MTETLKKTYNDFLNNQGQITQDIESAYQNNIELSLVILSKGNDEFDNEELIRMYLWLWDLHDKMDQSRFDFFINVTFLHIVVFRETNTDNTNSKTPHKFKVL